MASSRRVVYMSSRDYHNLCDKHPKVKERASITDSLIHAYGLKPYLVSVIPKVATREDLLTFHSEEYVKCLEKIQQTMEENYPAIIGEDSMYEEDIDYDNDEEFSEITKYGFGYDCGVFPQLYDYCKAVVGATIGAANILTANKADITINLNGGWHHAHVDEAAGFCYVNDTVIGILKLMTKFKKILYVDLDVHHGDGVEEAFMYSKKVMTLSLHKYEDGFFPGTGGGNDFQKSCHKYFSTNVPLKNGIDDTMFVNVFLTLFNDIMSKFQPEVIVCQCGADGLTGDPMGAFNLTSNGMVSCVEEICSKHLPVMILGGGGYNVPNTARCWTEIVAGILGKHLNEDIPEHDYLDKYGPGYSLSISPSNRKNENSEDYINDLIKLIKQNIFLTPKKINETQLMSNNHEKATDMPEMNGVLQHISDIIEVSETQQDDIITNTDKIYPEEVKSNQLPSCAVKHLLHDNDTQMSPKKVCVEKTVL